METRREFVKKAAVLSGAAGLWAALPESIQAAMAIDPEPGTTYLDAEHIVVLMQENRSFDHTYGALRGVRGFDDPRAISLPNGNPVWLQSNAAGETFAPFRLNLTETSATWMGSLPHSWGNQVDARNGGRYDQWLVAKPSGRPGYAKMPLTLGHYTRADIPFYYALADAFTVCDQHFCSSLTGTTPNRLYLWSGTIRGAKGAPACVLNEDVDYGREAHWTTFPERLEDAGVSWRIYQNELSLESGLEGEEDAWLSNFTDNPIEWFAQYNVRFSPGYRALLDKRAAELRAELGDEPDHGPSERRAELARLDDERARWSQENFDKLPARAKNLHRKAFTTNAADPNFRKLTELSYRDGDAARTLKVPAGDVLHQFRSDVAEGKLPTVSWLVAPENFSDHPGAAWYGAWYVSEVLDILTRNPDVWKKTVLILTYDENDGYFDHQPPFVAPAPGKPETGRVSAGIDTSDEYVTADEDRKRRPAGKTRESAIGLGYRVPLVIASPWTRGGWVCSEVFDHTSVLQFLERVLTHRTGKAIVESNISGWRRTVCGDLTSAFRPWRGEPVPMPEFVARDPFLEKIHRARYKKTPSEFRALSAREIAAARENPAKSGLVPRQEPGTRPSCALPYDLTGELMRTDQPLSGITLYLGVEKTFGGQSAGAPFTAYLRSATGQVQVRNYAVRAGDTVLDGIALDDFPGGVYDIRVYGPNGFYREARGSRKFEVGVELDVERGLNQIPTGKLFVRLRNATQETVTVTIGDAGYGGSAQTRRLRKGATAKVARETASSGGWYDIAVRCDTESGWGRRYAGRVETGKASTSDPQIGRV